MVEWGFDAEYLLSLPIQKFSMYCKLLIDYKKKEAKTISGGGKSSKTPEKKPIGQVIPKA